MPHVDKALDNATAANNADTDHDTDQSEAEQLLADDTLFKSLVVQRSRVYVKESMKTEGDGEVLFPKPRKPKVQYYSVKQTYGKLLKMIEV